MPCGSHSPRTSILGQSQRNLPVACAVNNANTIINVGSKPFNQSLQPNETIFLGAKQNDKDQFLQLFSVALIPTHSDPYIHSDRPYLRYTHPGQIALIIAYFALGISITT